MHGDVLLMYVSGSLILPAVNLFIIRDWFTFAVPSAKFQQRPLFLKEANICVYRAVLTSVIFPLTKQMAFWSYELERVKTVSNFNRIQKANHMLCTGFIANPRSTEYWRYVSIST